jgi:hypothetical protein
MIKLWSPLSLPMRTNTQPSILNRRVPQLAMSLSRRYSYFVIVVLVLLLPSMTVKGAVTCSRCKGIRIRTVFQDFWFCDLPVPQPPETENDICYTECNPRGLSLDRFTCNLLPIDVANSRCICNEIPPPSCPPGRQTTAYRCAETLYVCWNLVPPQVSSDTTRRVRTVGRTAFGFES